MYDNWLEVALEIGQLAFIRRMEIRVGRETYILIGRYRKENYNDLYEISVKQFEFVT